MIQVRDVMKSFDGTPLLRGISLEIARGEIACLLGPSGSGKTTLLRIIAGLEDAESGAVLFEGRDLRNVPTHQRGFGLMFQDLALFPHRDVFGNVAFGLRMQNLARAEIEGRVREMLMIVGLEKLSTRDIHQLSGGEQQRVALARALAPRPRLLMFDEPLGALDRILREQLVVELRAILKQLNMTALYVTHDQSEAFGVADRVLIIHDGVIEQSGKPQEVYEHPASVFVARFLGLDNILRGQVTSIDAQAARIETPLGIFVCPASRVHVGTEISLLLRPDAARAIKTDSIPEMQENVLRGQVIESRFRAGHPSVTIVSNDDLRFVFDWTEPLSLGEQVSIELDQSRISSL